MNNIQTLFLMITALTFIFACNPNSSKSNIHLNDGEKWNVNSEMKPHIEKGEKILNEFISKNDTDYPQLAKKLNKQNNALIQSCTMTGESHEELHKWLHPHMELIKALSNVQDLDEAREILSKLEASFKTYHTYFQ